MENRLALYIDVPGNYDQQLRSRVEASSKECLKEGYQAAGWATLEAIVAAIASDGVTVANSSAWILERTREAVTQCLQREGAILGRDLAAELTLQATTVSRWSDWR